MTELAIEASNQSEEANSNKKMLKVNDETVIPTNNVSWHLNCTNQQQSEYYVNQPPLDISQECHIYSTEKPVKLNEEEINSCLDLNTPTSEYHVEQDTLRTNSQASLNLYWQKALRKIASSSLIGSHDKCKVKSPACHEFNVIADDNNQITHDIYTWNDLDRDSSDLNTYNQSWDYCFRVIRSPNIHTFTDLKNTIQDSTSEWILIFLRNNGLGALFEALEKLCERKCQPSLVDTFLQLRCVECIKAIMNSQTGLDCMIENKDFIIKKFSQALDNKDTTVKKQILDLLSALCVYSADGYGRVLDVLQHYQETKKCRYRFSPLVEELRAAETTEYKTTLLSLINCIVITTEKLEERVRIRNEFIALKLVEVLNKIRSAEPEDPDLTVQLDVFDQWKANDDDELPGADGVDLNSHLDVFHAIIKQVTDTPQEIPFLAILQHFLQLEPSEPLSDVIWDTIEKLVYRATLLEKKEDQDKLLLSGSKRLDKAVGQKLCENCQCQCHKDGGDHDSRMRRESQLSPTSPKLKHKGAFPLTGMSPNPSAPPIPAAVSPPPLPGENGKPGSVPVAPPPPPPIGGIGLVNGGVPPPPPLPPGAPAAPPPPPGLPGAPPAPPNSLTSPALSTIKLPQQQTPKPKSKLRKLQWNKIPMAKVVGKKNFWTHVGKTYGLDTKVNYDTMEELFAVKSSKPEEKESAENNNNGTGTLERKKKSEVVNLLDAKKSLNVNIFLRQFRIPTPEMMEHLLKGESEKFGAEKLRGLLKIIPEVDEVGMLRSYSGDKTKLGTAEKFYIELIELPNYQLRIEAMLMKEDFTQTLEWIKPAIDAIIITSRDLQDSKSLHEILYMVLLAGNYLNDGGYSGDAAGFKLGSLLKLTEIRANKPRMNLMHYVVQQAEDKNPQLLQLTDDFRYLKEASQYSVEGIASDIKGIQGKLKSISEQLQTDQEFQQQVSGFLEMAHTEMEELEQDLEELEKLREELADYFCEDSVTFKLEECLKTFSTFCLKFNKALQENKERAMQEEKAEVRKKQREEQLQQTMEKKKRRPSGDKVSGDKPNNERVNDKGRPNSGASDDGDSNIVDKLLGDIRSGFTKGKFKDSTDFQITKVQKVKLDENLTHNGVVNGDSKLDNVEDTVDFSRNAPLRGSGKKNTLIQNRLKAIEEAGLGGATSDEGRDKRVRKSAEIKDDLFDYLLQSGEDSENHLFERQGSLRRRRRNRNMEIKNDRERATSPISISPARTHSPAPHSPVSVSPLVTGQVSKAKSEEENQSEIKRWSSSSSEAPNSEKSDDHVSESAKQRRLERRKRNNLDVTDMLTGANTNKESETFDRPPVFESPKNTKNNYPVPDVNIDINDKASRQYLIERARSRFISQNGMESMDMDSDLFDDQFESNHTASGQRTHSNVETSTVDKFLRNRETNNNIKDLSAKFRANTDDGNVRGLAYKSILDEDDLAPLVTEYDSKINVDDVIKHVQRTGQEMEGMFKPVDGDSQRNKYQQLLANRADKSNMDEIFSSLKSDNNSNGQMEKQSITEMAWLQHVKDTERQRSNIDKNDVDDAFKTIKQEVGHNRPFSTYDNIPDLNPVLAYGNSGDVSSHSSSNASISTNDSTDTLTPIEPGSFGVSSRLARILQRQPTGEEEPVGLKRSSTLPKRWRSNFSPSRGDPSQSIQEEDAGPTLRSQRIMSKTRAGDRKVKPVTGSTFTGTRYNLESRELDSNVQDFQSRASEDDKNRMQSRFRALSQRYAKSDEEPIWPHSDNIPDNIHNKDGAPIGIHTSSSISGGQTISPRSMRSSEDGKCDSDSVASSKDEGFESESVSDPNVSQRTSMSSTLEQEIHKPEEESRDNLFARSFDSLVKNEFVTTEINIDDDASINSTNTCDKTPTHDKTHNGLAVYKGKNTDKSNNTIKHISAKQVKSSTSEFSKTKKATGTKSDLPPTPPERTTSKSKASSTISSPRTTKTTTPPKVPTGSSSVKAGNTSSVFSRLNTPKDKTPTSTRRSSAASSGSSTPKGTRRSTTTQLKDTASAVTARLAASAASSRPRKPSLSSGLSRHPSNSSLTSETNSVTNTPSPRTRTRPPAKPISNISRTASKSPASAIRSPRNGSRNSSRNGSTDDLLSSPKGSFVRGAAGRATMPASVLRANKRTAAENKGGATSGSIDSSAAPTPPRRTSSIRTTTDRLSKPPITSPSLNMKSVNEGSNGSTTPRRPRKSAPIGIAHKLDSPKTPRRQQNGIATQHSEIPDVHDSSFQRKDKSGPSVFQRLMAKTPSKRTETVGDKKGKLGLNATSKSSNC